MDAKKFLDDLDKLSDAEAAAALLQLGPDGRDRPRTGLPFPRGAASEMHVRAAYELISSVIGVLRRGNAADLLWLDKVARSVADRDEEGIKARRGLVVAALTTFNEAFPSAKRMEQDGIVCVRDTLCKVDPQFANLSDAEIVEALKDFDSPKYACTTAAMLSAACGAFGDELRASDTNAEARGTYARLANLYRAAHSHPAFNSKQT